MPEEPTTNTDKEITITVPLKEFLQILWGYKWKGEFADYRERAAPSDAIIAALEALPKDVQERYFKIVKARPTVEAIVWEKGEWDRSGQKELEAKAASDVFNFQSDELTDWLVNKSGNPIFRDRTFTRQIAFAAVRSGDFTQFKLFGLDDATLEKLKTGKYER